MRKVAIFLLSAIGTLTSSLSAATITIDFGTGSGVTSGWAGTSNASSSSTGVAITNPVVMAGGALQMAGSPGSVFCTQGVTAGTCGTSTGLTTGTAYGLGVANARVDASESLTLTVNPGYIVTILGYGLTGFSSGEAALLTINGVGSTINAPATNVALDSFTVNGGLGTQITSSVVFGIVPGNTGNYSLATLTVDVTAVPEPSTLGLMAVACAGLIAGYRRKLAK